MLSSVAEEVRLSSVAEEVRLSSVAEEVRLSSVAEEVSLSSVAEEVRLAIHSDISRSEVLYSLLSAPWLQSLLKIYECLQKFRRLPPSPYLPYASGLSHEILSNIRAVPAPSPEARQLYSLLKSPHLQ
ncbi:MAGUK p55 subfamily member 4-like, partial [Oncorhynchus masou masou]|uniref:MAGUK p55 subfamily member 4-like n=1 Tax=Oncorhynchus masou masou TaxID=90313 RepID=UPI00318391A1